MLTTMIVVMVCSLLLAGLFWFLSGRNDDKEVEVDIELKGLQSRRYKLLSSKDYEPDLKDIQKDNLGDALFELKKELPSKVKSKIDHLFSYNLHVEPDTLYVVIILYDVEDLDDIKDPFINHLFNKLDKIDLSLFDELEVSFTLGAGNRRILDLVYEIPKVQDESKEEEREADSQTD